MITMSALRAAQDLGRELTIGGFDLTPELLSAIEAGDVAFTVDQAVPPGLHAGTSSVLERHECQHSWWRLADPHRSRLCHSRDASDVIALSAQGTADLISAICSVQR